MTPSIAIIGCGLIGETHAECLHALGVTPRLFADVSHERAATLAAHFGARWSADSESALTDPAIDSVYICTYHDTHASFTKIAADARKNIFLEKPMAITMQDCHTIEDAVRQNKIRCMTGFKLRYASLARQARDLVPNPTLLTARVFDTKWPDAHWANDPIKGGGNVLSQGCHAVDMLCFLACSEPVAVAAMSANLHHPGLPITDSLAATIRFASGAIASLTIADAGNVVEGGKFAFQSMDGERTLTLDNRMQRLTYWDGNTSQIFHGVEDGFENENKEWMSALIASRTPETTEQDGSRATTVLLAAIEANRTSTTQFL